MGIPLLVIGNSLVSASPSKLPWMGQVHRAQCPELARVKSQALQIVWISHYVVVRRQNQSSGDITENKKRKHFPCGRLWGAQVGHGGPELKGGWSSSHSAEAAVLGCHQDAFHLDLLWIETMVQLAWFSRSATESDTVIRNGQLSDPAQEHVSKVTVAGIFHDKPSA